MLLVTYFYMLEVESARSEERVGVAAYFRDLADGVYSGVDRIANGARYVGGGFRHAGKFLTEHPNVVRVIYFGTLAGATAASLLSGNAGAEAPGNFTYDYAGNFTNGTNATNATSMTSESQKPAGWEMLVLLGALTVGFFVGRRRRS